MLVGSINQLDPFQSASRHLVILDDWWYGYEKRQNIREQEAIDYPQVLQQIARILTNSLYLAFVRFIETSGFQMGFSCGSTRGFPSRR